MNCSFDDDASEKQQFNISPLHIFVGFYEFYEGPILCPWCLFSGGINERIATVWLVSVLMGFQFLFPFNHSY